MHPHSDWLHKYHGTSRLALRPTTTQQVASLLAHCAGRRLAVVPQGGNTGLVGGSVPVFDEVVLSLGAMNKVISFDEVSSAVASGKLGWYPQMYTATCATKETRGSPGGSSQKVTHGLRRGRGASRGSAAADSYFVGSHTTPSPLTDTTHTTTRRSLACWWRKQGRCCRHWMRL